MNSQEPENATKGDQGNSNKKEEGKVSLFVDNKILYVKYSKNPITKLIHLKNLFSQVARNKINTQNPLTFQMTNGLRKKVGK